MNKSIICINGSRSITNIDLDRFIYPEHVECLILGGANGIDIIAENWAKRHDLEYMIFYPQWAVYGKSAGMKCNEAMLDVCDVLISFWDGKSPETKHAIEYAIKINRPYICHLVQELD